MAHDSPTSPESELDRRLARNFIEKIERDRDHELQSIVSEMQSAIDRILEQAYQSAREFHRESAARARSQYSTQADLLTARAHARLRRESWRAMRHLQESALERMRNRLHQMFGDPELQWAWCGHWLQTALLESGDHPLDITVGLDIKPETVQRLETALRNTGASWSMKFDDAIGYGLMIAWSNHLLDGRIEAQIPYLADAVFKRLAGELHRRPEGDQE